MAISVFKNKRLEVTYQKSRLPQRRNPIFIQRLDGVQCKYCIISTRNSKGRKKYYHSLNQLHGHLSYDHRTEDFKEYLMGLADLVISGNLQ
jgi:hypothetical protein